MNYTKWVYNATGTGSWIAPAGCTSVRLTLTPAVAKAALIGNTGVTAVLDPYGKILTAGTNLQGGLGTNTPGGIGSAASSPVVVVGSQQWTQFWTATTGIFANNSLGQLYAWGGGPALGVNASATGSVSSPALVVGNLPLVTNVVGSSSNAGTYFLLANGQIFYSGANSQGEGGLNNVTPYSTPVAVVGGYTFSQVFGGLYCGYAVTPSGALYSWGGNGFGQLGTNSLTAAFSSPVLVVGGQFWASVYANQSYGVWGLTMSGQAYGWGSNQIGWLGNNIPQTTTAAYSSPVAVVGGLTFSMLALGNQTVCGLTTAGQAYCWGSNYLGACGNNVSPGTVANYSSPVAVVGGYSFAQIFGDTGYPSSFFGMTSAGALYAWGANTFGQLGINSVIPQSSPVLVQGGITWAQFNVTGQTCVGVSTTGLVYAWGCPNSGETMANNLTALSTPTLVFAGGVASAKLTPAQPTVVVLPVTPGQTYNFNYRTVSWQAWQAATFGSTLIGQGVFASLTLEYFA